MARKPRIEFDYEPADSFIGITASIPLYRLVHHINQTTFLNLVCEKDIPVYFEKPGASFNFSFFHCRDEDSFTDFCMVSNSNEGLKLIPKLKQFNYLLILQGALPQEKCTQLVSRIKDIQGVQIAASINQEPLPELGPILQDIELHLIELKKEKAGTLKNIMPSAEEQ